MVTAAPASVFRKRLLSNCQLRSAIATVLSLSTTRSVCTVNIQSRSERVVRRNAVPGSCRRYCELLVEYPNVALAQEGMGAFQSSDAGQPQLLGQPSLPGAETAFAAPACLRRI